MPHSTKLLDRPEASLRLAAPDEPDDFDIAARIKYAWGVSDQEVVTPDQPVEGHGGSTIMIPAFKSPPIMPDPKSKRAKKPVAGPHSLPLIREPGLLPRWERG